MYSLRMSFWSVPEICVQSAPCFSATTRYIAHMMLAGELIVIEVVVFSRSIPEKSVSMSSSESMATPHLPTSPSLSGSSESQPISVGRSKATERPSPPLASRYL